jgi:hypothetical protein
MTTAEALADLERMVVRTSDPTLSASDMNRLVELARIADVYGNPPDAYSEWKASEHVSSAQTRVPVSRNGYVYRAISSGHTGATEPTWPKTIGATVSDHHVTWECYAEAPWRWTWDLAGAASVGWSWKAAKAATDVSFSADGLQVSVGDLIKHCRLMSEIYARQSVGTVTSVSVESPRSYPRSWDRRDTPPF